MTYYFSPTVPGVVNLSTGFSINGQAASIALRARGVPVPLLITPVGLDLGTLPLNTAAPTQVVNVKNVGATAIVGAIAGGGLLAPFTNFQNCQGATINPGQSCQITFGFTPTAEGAFTATSAGNVNGQAFSIVVQGVGQASVAGGRGFKVKQASGGVEMTWASGDIQDSYLIARFAMFGGTNTLLPPGGPMPPNAVTYTDVTAAVGDLYCYLLFPLKLGAVVGTSDLECTMPGTGGGSPRAGDFAIQLNQSPTASLTWTAPVGGVNGYTLNILPIGGALSTQVLPGSATSYSHATGGGATCYFLTAASGASSGNTDWLCGTPGFSSLSVSGLGGPAKVAIDAVDHARLSGLSAAGGLPQRLEAR